MKEYVKLEATGDGHLLQSSITVPSSGTLPRKATTALCPEKARLYSETIFTPHVTACVDDESQIHSLYIPRPLKGRGYFKLTLPALLMAAGFLGSNTVFTTGDSLPLMIHIAIDFVVALTVVILFFIPSILWGRHVYVQGAPDRKAQKLIAINYPNIPIHRNYYLFTKDERTNNDFPL